MKGGTRSCIYQVLEVDAILFYIQLLQSFDYDLGDQFLTFHSHTIQKKNNLSVCVHM